MKCKKCNNIFEKEPANLQKESFVLNVEKSMLKKHPELTLILKNAQNVVQNFQKECSALNVEHLIQMQHNKLKAQ